MDRIPLSRVLVTRSEPGASETAARLAGLGYQPVVEPLFGIEPLAAELPPFDALAFTSANGVRALAKLDAALDSNVPVFCVGGRTADAARDAGFVSVSSADGDVANLASMICSKLQTGTRLLHTGNEESRGDLAGVLTARGIAAVFVPTFRAAPVKAPGPALAAHLAGRRSFDAVLIHSPRGGTILATFANGAPRAALNVAAISRAAAAPLSQIADRIEIAERPNEAALMDALSRLSLSR